MKKKKRKKETVSINTKAGLRDVVEDTLWHIFMGAKDCELDIWDFMDGLYAQGANVEILQDTILYLYREVHNPSEPKKPFPRKGHLTLNLRKETKREEKEEEKFKNKRKIVKAKKGVLVHDGKPI